MRKINIDEIEELLRILDSSKIYDFIIIKQGETQQQGFDDPCYYQFNSKMIYRDEDGDWVENNATEYSNGGFDQGNVKKIKQIDIFNILQNLEDDAYVALHPKGTHIGSLSYVFKT